jgi:glucose/arabinose dehydrogenase
MNGYMIKKMGVAVMVLWLMACGGSGGKKAAEDTSGTVTTRPHDTPYYTGAETDTVAGIDTAAAFTGGDEPVPARVSHPIHLQKGVDLQLNTPEGYHIGVAFEGLRRLRFLAKSPDGRLFATDMFNTSDNKRGKVYIFDDWDSAGRQFRTVRTFLEGLHNPNQVDFYNDEGRGYIYISETGKLSRLPYRSGDTVPSGPAELVATWPDYGLDYKYGGWHLTRSLAFHGRKLYVSVGSSCNACIEKEDVRATIQEMNPDGSDRHVFATGLRNSVGIKWVGDELWSTGMGRDLLGPDKPEDLLEKIGRGVSYGWPYYFQYNKTIYPDTAMQRMAREAGQALPPPPPVAWCGFLAHSAPLGFDYFKDFTDPLLHDAFVVALHGSTTVSRQRGNSIVKITGRGGYVPIVDGFLSGRTEADRKGRPCDVLMKDARSFFFTDDKNGVLYYVWKE